MQPRTYRSWVDSRDMVAFNVVVKETDLHVLASVNLKRKAYRLVVKSRGLLDKYIEQNPVFLTTLEPMDVGENSPQIVRAMAEAGAKAGVGPMAAVAGAIDDFVANDLLPYSSEMIIENGGDIYLKSQSKRVVGVYAGSSPLTGRIGIEIDSHGRAMGISTSSGTVGHSLSFGKADAATIIAETATLSDAVATAVGNRVKQPEDIPCAIDFGKRIPGVRGILIIMGEQVGVWGEVKLCETNI